ncbi:MAG TPA: DUF4870 domain-containing protein [Ktedonobacterales bacterium]
MTNASGTIQQGPQYVLRSPSVGERAIAATAHLLVLLNLPGIVVTAIILLLSRRGSPYVRHHARRAIRLQLFENALTIGLLAIFAAIIVGSGFLERGKGSGMALDTAFGAGLGILFVVVVLFSVETIIFGIPAIFGALRALATSQFRYPIAAAR